jgi:hypothetical protein
MPLLAGGRMSHARRKVRATSVDDLADAFAAHNHLALRHWMRGGALAVFAVRRRASKRHADVTF